MSAPRTVLAHSRTLADAVLEGGAAIGYLDGTPDGDVGERDQKE
jgi:hypothetical protein